MPGLRLAGGRGARRTGIGFGMAALLAAMVALPVGSPPGTIAQNGTPPAAASPPADEALGLTREDPAPLGQETVGGGYAVTVLEVVQGEEAATRVAEANQGNEPAPEGQEYVLARVRVRNVGDDQAPIAATPANFGLTASGNRLYPAATAVAPEPALSGQLFADGQAEGWLVLLVGSGETDRELVVLPGAGTDPTLFRYLALEPGASIPVGDAAPAAGTPSALGAVQEAPAPPGETVETTRFQVAVVEFVRGEDATRLLKEVTEFNPDPLPANEHALVRVRVTYVGAEEGPVAVTPADFGLIGTGNVRYTQAALVPPEPVVDARLYRGGSVEGWLAFEIQRNEADLLLIAQEAGDPNAEVRYLTLPPPSEAPPAQETPAG